MLWDTLWALVLGFGLSGAVQAFASRESMGGHLGDHRPAAVTRASLYGMASSSCSYAAAAMARSLFSRGADFLAAMVFMFASTNLVVELGIVLVVLISWQFVAAELVGGLPLAAALWKGGIAFGGVVAFIFADLITLPLVLVYRKQYGGAMALRLLGTFWPVMSAAGLATEYLFRAIGWVPTARPGAVVGDTLRWNYTTILDIVALAVLTGLYFLYRHRERLGGGAGYAKDPVCGMQVETATAPASTTTHDGRRVYFCSEHCAERFAASTTR